MTVPTEVTVLSSGACLRQIAGGEIAGSEGTLSVKAAFS